jgi:hypothetical protein
MAEPLHDVAVEASKVLDDLAVISHDLACHARSRPGDDKVITAAEVNDVCKAINDAVQCLRRILKISAERGHGLIPGDN